MSRDDRPPDDADLAALLRESLVAEAGRHVPAGDGLARIRKRVEGRRRKLAFSRPGLTIAAAAAAVAAFVLVPAVLKDSGGPSPHQAGSGGTHPTPASAAPTGTAPLPTEARTTISGSGDLHDMRTVWPYASRGEGTAKADRDVRAGVHAELAQPTQAAVTFVRSYVGADVPLSARPAGPLSKGIGVVVYRDLPDGTRHAVSQVYLVRVRRAVDSPYVVAAASRPSLDGDRYQLTVVPPAEPLGATADRISVTGRSVRPGEPAPVSVQVEVRDATAAQHVGFNLAEPRRDPSRADTFSWGTTLSVDAGQLAAADTIAAWTVDSTGFVLEFVATPVPLA
ncbi:MAG TPA: hypothetical protein VLJ59_13195 [Mycobacteriales bacterium]|nr:hypothetical protein [Mycobacteriales bacterium]